MNAIKDSFWIRLIALVALFVSPFLFLSPQPAQALRKTADEVYVQPIEGLDKTGLFGPTQKEIITSVIQDNYQVYCAAPAQEVSAEIGKKYIRYLELYFGNTKIHKPETILTANDDIFNPLVLDDTGEEQQAVFNESKESYVQYLNNSKANPDPLLEEVVTADYYKLLSIREQCVLQKEAQKRVGILCGKLDVPLSECPLNVPIPNTGGDTKIMEVDIPSCNNITKPNLIKSLSNLGATLIELANLPISQVYGKRPAFLVTCVEQIKAGGSIWGGGSAPEDLALYMWTNWRDILSSLFGLLKHKLNLRKDECHVRTILVDSPTTEQEPQNSMEAHNVSRKVLMKLDDQVAEQEAYDKAKGARREIALGKLAKGFSADERVNLVGSANSQTQALTHMINGLAPVCSIESIRDETAPTITSEAHFTEGGPKYKATGRTAADDFGLLESLFAKLGAEIETGERTKNDIEQRGAIIETFIIAPYDAQITMDQFLTTLDDYEAIQTTRESDWPTHVLFNKGIGEGQEYSLSSGSSTSDQEFWDPEDCKTVTHRDKETGEVYEELDCTQVYTVGITDMEQYLGVPVLPAKTQSNVRVQLTGLKYETPVHSHVERYSSTPLANSEVLIKGTAGSSGDDGDDDEQDIGDVLAKCNGGPRVGSGEDSQNICQSTGEYCTPEEINANNDCTLLESQHYIPNWQNGGDGYKPCSEELYSYIACNPEYEDALIANMVDSNGNFSQSGTMTACEYVVSEAKAAGVSPAFALAMWGEESGWSSYRDAYAFGVTSAGKLDLGDQVAAFLGTVKGKSDYLAFMKQYSGEKEPGNVFCNNAHFPARLRAYYDYLAL